MTGDHLPVQFSEGVDQIRSDQILLLKITVMRQEVNAEFYATEVESLPGQTSL